MKKHAYRVLVTALGLLLLSGCAGLGSYGKVRWLPREEQNTTLQQLIVNWEDYRISYTGLSVGTAAGVMFDPRSDDKSLVGDRWTKVKDQQTLSKLIRQVESYVDFYPKLSRILGPDNQFYGYLFYASPDHPVFKVVDKDTLYTYDLESPVYWNGRGKRGL